MNSDKYKVPFWGSTAICIFVAVVALGLHFTERGNSQKAVSARSRALENIAKHVNSESCWIDRSDTPFKIGDPLITRGSETGRIPTSCVIAPNAGQFLEVAYKNSELQVIRVFSNKEINAAKSQLGRNK